MRVGAKASEQIVDQINRHWVIKIEAFDVRAALEVPAMTRDARDRPAPRDVQTTWAKLKYDRQIVAIAKVNRATIIYSDDKGVRTVAERAGVDVKGLADLPLPPEKPSRETLPPVRKDQMDLPDGARE